MKEHSTDTQRHRDRKRYQMPDKSGNEVAMLLTKIQQQLYHLERRVDSIIDMLQEKHHAQRSPDEKHFRKKTHPSTTRSSGRLDSAGSGKQKRKYGEKGPRKPFYSRFADQDKR